METLRDNPEISPCSASEKLDWTTLTDAVSITPTPAPNSSKPGANVQNPDWLRTRTSSKTRPTAASRKPATISDRWVWRRANRSAPAEVARIPMVAGVSSSPVLIAS